jgi:hypothetical protein
VHPRLLGGLNLLGWIISTVLALTGWVSHLLGYILLALMLPVTVWMFWPWLKSWGRWWPLALARTVSQLRSKLRETEQENQKLRERNEQLDRLNKNLEVERDQRSDLLQETKRENSKLRESSGKSGLPLSPQEIAERRIGYHDSPIRLMDLLEVAGDNGVLRDFEFEHCILEGPGVINLEGPFPKSNSAGSMASSLPTHCRVEGSPDTTLLQVADHNKPPVGVIHLSGYKFEAVTFRGLGFIGTPEHLEHLKSRLAFSEGSTDE